LSKELQIGIVTVKRAYDDLVNEGFVFSQSARGYFVSEIDIDKVQSMYLSRINDLFDEVIRLKEDANIDFQLLEEILRQKGEEQNE
jgi:DNA-binding transcriptional regulator YhcF (GntR family)